MKSFGTFLRYVRKQRNLTQEQVAERLNIVTPVLSKWENDKAVPSLDMICKLCNILNVSIEEYIAKELSDGEHLLPPEHYAPEMLGETIKDLRIKNGWSQSEVGKRLFVSSQTVSKWEAGSISSLEVLCNLAEVFGLSPTELLNKLTPVKKLPSVQKSAKQSKKHSNITVKITAIVLAILIFLGAVAGLIIGLVLTKRSGDENTPEEDENTPEVLTFVTPVNEFYSVTNGGQGNFDNFVFGCMFFEVANDTPVFAIADGTVTFVSSVINNVFIEIEHAEGFVSKYFYIEESLQVGEKVNKGQQLSTVSSKSFYIDLYRNGEKVDPFEYITELPESVPRPPEHVHEWGDWQTTANYHYQSCECGQDSVKDLHEYKDNICTVCGYQKYIPPEPPLPSDEDKALYCLPMQSNIYRFYGDDCIDSWGDPSKHMGVDFSAEEGDKVYAVADGVIENIIIYNSSYGGAYGCLRINHGSAISVYNGIITSDNLHVGDNVVKGQEIGVVAEEPHHNELDDGPHLHFNMTVNGVVVNPLDYLTYNKQQT